MLVTTRPPGPVAFLYARLSYDESHQHCSECRHEWQHTSGTVATCPACGRQTPIDLPNSIERQTDRMRHWCQAKWSNDSGPKLVLVQELGTGFKSFAHRPESQTILQCARPGDFLVVCKIDRGWRNAQDFHRTVDALEKLQVTLMVVEEQYDTSTAIGRFMVNLSVALAQLERDRTSERTKAQIAWHRERGLSCGNHTRFGTRVTIDLRTGKKIVVDDVNELRLAKWIYEMRFVKGVPWNCITEVAAKLGFVNRAGNPFNCNKLRDLGTVAKRLKASGKLDRIT